MNAKEYKFWFIVGSQTLYGPEVLDTVAERGCEMAAAISKSGIIPWELEYKATVKSSQEILDIIRKANNTPECAGVITWMHTFSPSKMWINGLVELNKPYLHFATQYNREIPNEKIDMDFMNLNQAAHGDREHGFIAARLRAKRKIIAGFWQDEDVLLRIADWMRAAVGSQFSKSLKVMRFGDNMRYVAVTEGDKVEAQIKLGWQVNTWPVGKLVEHIENVTQEQQDSLISEYEKEYTINTTDLQSVRYQAKCEIAMQQMLDEEDCKAFSNTFENLYGMEQLPGLATQRLLGKGYGYAGEGDWKVSALTAVMKAMAAGVNKGGTGFIEDYTYDLTKGNELSLGAHMLEVCPSFATQRPKIEVHPLGIGGKNPPARLVFEGGAGSAIITTLVDMGGRFRLICHDIECVSPTLDMPNLPVARLMWRGMPDTMTGTEAWITAGGAHHGVLSYDLNAEIMASWAEIMGIEFVHISKDTTIANLNNQLFLNDLAYKLSDR